MSAASRFTPRGVVTREDRASECASVELRLNCWLERVARLIARRDTPREPEVAPRPEAATPPAT